MKIGQFGIKIIFVEGTWSGEASQQRSHILTPSLPASDTETPAATKALEIKKISDGYCSTTMWYHQCVRFLLHKVCNFEIFLVVKCDDRFALIFIGYSLSYVLIFKDKVLNCHLLPH